MKSIHAKKDIFEKRHTNWQVSKKMTREEALKYAKFRLECYSKGDGEYTEHGEFLVAAIEALEKSEPYVIKGENNESNKF